MVGIVAVPEPFKQRERLPAIAFRANIRVVFEIVVIHFLRRAVKDYIGELFVIVCSGVKRLFYKLTAYNFPGILFVVAAV